MQKIKTHKLVPAKGKHRITKHFYSPRSESRDSESDVGELSVRGLFCNCDSSESSFFLFKSNSRLSNEMPSRRIGPSEAPRGA
jgi:hypothetical protein